MKLKLKSALIPVLGWCDISECSCYEKLAENVSIGDSIICNSILDLEDDELCTFIFFDDYSEKTLYAVFSGRVEYLGRHTDHSAPYTYIFYPEKIIKVKGVGYDKETEHPQAVMMKSKKL